MDVLRKILDDGTIIYFKGEHMEYRLFLDNNILELWRHSYQKRSRWIHAHNSINLIEMLNFISENLD